MGTQVVCSRSELSARAWALLVEEKTLGCAREHASGTHLKEKTPLAVAQERTRRCKDPSGAGVNNPSCAPAAALSTGDAM